jgi:phosphonate degradation associated HDIG domain protein
MTFMEQSSLSTFDDLFDILVSRGGKRYGNEPVTQLEHALQCAAMAERHGATASLITAALLHDIGHMIHTLGVQPTARGVDDRHEIAGAEALARWFGHAVAEPVRLHVPAKRYLCAVEPTYAARLSAGSVRSLELQGGPMSEDDIASFERRQFMQDATQLRRWDENAKISGLQTPKIEHFRRYAEMVREP